MAIVEVVMTAASCIVLVLPQSRLLLINFRIILLLLLLGVVVLLNNLLEWIICSLWTLLANDLVHVAGCAIDNGWLRNAIRSAATLRSRALAGVVRAQESSALFHRFLTQL